MSDSSHRFLVGFTKALERRKERTKEQAARKVATDAVAIDVVTSLVRTRDGIITTQQDHDEQYKQAIVQSMTTLIKQREMK